jgi:hypothetical protein
MGDNRPFLRGGSYLSSAYYIKASPVACKHRSWSLSLGEESARDATSPRQKSGGPPGYLGPHRPLYRTRQGECLFGRCSPQCRLVKDMARRRIWMPCISRIVIPDDLHLSRVTPLCPPRREDQLVHIEPHAFDHLGQRSGAGGRRPDEQIPHQHQRRPEADPMRRELPFLGQQVNFSTHQVVRDRHAPELLPDMIGSLRTQSFLLFQGMGFQLVVTNFQFPSLMVKIDDLGRRIGLRVQQRGEQHLVPKSLPLIMDGPGQNCVRPIGMNLSARIGNGHFHQIIPSAQSFDHAPLQIPSRTKQPVTIRSAPLQFLQLDVVRKISVQDRDRLIGNPLNQRPGQRPFASGKIGEVEVQPQMAVQGHQPGDPHLRITRRTTSRTRQMERLTVLRAVGNAQRRSSSPKNRQSSPPRPIRRFPSPMSAGRPEQRFQRLHPDPIPCLGNGSLGHLPHLPVRLWKHQIQSVNDFNHRTVSIQRHADHQPDHLFHRQLSPTDCRHSLSRQCVFDPFQIHMRSQPFERGRKCPIGQRFQGRGQIQKSPPRKPARAGRIESRRNYYHLSTTYALN